jgi:hypothetical protein
MGYLEAAITKIYAAERGIFGTPLDSFTVFESHFEDSLILLLAFPVTRG